MTNTEYSFSHSSKLKTESKIWIKEKNTYIRPEVKIHIKLLIWTKLIRVYTAQRRQGTVNIELRHIVSGSPKNSESTSSQIEPHSTVGGIVVALTVSITGHHRPAHIDTHTTIEWTTSFNSTENHIQWCIREYTMIINILKRLIHILIICIISFYAGCNNSSMPNFNDGWAKPPLMLTHWGRDKMDAISQTTFSNAFSWMKIYEFRLSCHWSLFVRVQLTIFQHWFRQWLGADQATSHYLNQ